MKPRALILFLLFLVPARLFAFWIPRPVDQLVWDAEVIVIGEYEGYDPVKPGFLTGQSARFRIVQTFKGKIPASFRVSGSDSGMCLPIVDFAYLKPGRYLMFLIRMEEEAWHTLDATLMPVLDDRVAWQEPLEQKTTLVRIKDLEQKFQRILKRSPPKPSVPAK